MTLQEIRNEVAKTFYNFNNWEDFRSDGLDWRVYEEAHETVAEMCANYAYDAGYHKALTHNRQEIAYYEFSNCREEYFKTFNEK